MDHTEEFGSFSDFKINGRTPTFLRKEEEDGTKTITGHDFVTNSINTWE